MDRRLAQEFANMAAFCFEQMLTQEGVEETILLDPDVSKDGKPYLVIHVEPERFEAYDSKFNESAEMTYKGHTMAVPVIVKPMGPGGALN